MTTMKALRFEKYGPPSVLSIQELRVPSLKPGEALVELHAAAINPSDVKNVAGSFNAPLPRVPGRDYAGVVVAGDGWKGKEVWGSGAGLGVARDGTHGQYLVVDVVSLSKKPSLLSMEEASAVGVPYLAAWSVLVHEVNLKAGETVLITGVHGALGRAAIQIAHWKKARVIGADRSDKPCEADAFVNTMSHDLPVEVKALTDGKGADLVLDIAGGPVFEPSLKSLRLGGRQVAISSMGTGRVEYNLVDYYDNRLRLTGLDIMKLTGPEIAKIMNELQSGFEDGHLRPSPIQTWKLDRGIEAYEAAEKGATSNMQVLLPRG